MITSQPSRKDLAQLLRERNVYPTRQRIEIAYALFCRRQHLCADEIMAIVNEHESATSKATVYNTLKLLVEKRLVREVIVDGNKTFYDPNTDPHFHMYDITTGRLTDIDASGVSISGLPPLPEGMQDEGLDLIVRVRSKFNHPA